MISRYKASTRTRKQNWLRSPEYSAVRRGEIIMCQRFCVTLYGCRTAAVVEFEKTAPSVKYSTLTQMMQSRFHEVVKEKDHVLGDKLQALSRLTSLSSTALSAFYWRRLYSRIVIIRVCDSVCLKRIKLKSPNLALRPARYLAYTMNMRSKGQRLRSRVTKCITSRRDSRAAPSRCGCVVSSRDDTTAQDCLIEDDLVVGISYVLRWVPTLYSWVL